jgi:hypothetical protein
LTNFSISRNTKNLLAFQGTPLPFSISRNTNMAFGISRNISTFQYFKEHQYLSVFQGTPIHFSISRNVFLEILKGNGVP